MKKIVRTALIGSLLFVPGIALPGSAQNGIYFDMVDAGKKDKATIAVALGKQSGAYLYRDLKNKVSCRGVLLNADGEGINFVATSGQTLRSNVGPCPEGARFSLQRTDALNVKALIVTDEFERAMHLSPVFIAPDKDATPPEGADVLGIELGMEEADITRLLVEDQGFYKSSLSPKIEMSTSGKWQFAFPSFRPKFKLTDFLEGDRRLGPTIQAYYDGQTRYPVLFFTAKQGLETARDIAKAEHIAIILVNGKAAYIRRQLRVDENSTDAIFEALSGKYGSFPRGTYAGFHDFLGNKAASDGWYSALGDFGGGAQGNWGAAVYKSDGSMMRHESAKKLQDTHRLGNGCTSLHQQSGYHTNVDYVHLSSYSICAAGTFFSVISGGWAQISVFRTGVFAENDVNAFFHAALPAFLEKAKGDLQKSGDIGTPIVPKL